MSDQRRVDFSEWESLDDMLIDLILHPHRYPLPFWLADDKSGVQIDEDFIAACRRVALARNLWD